MGTRPAAGTSAGKCLEWVRVLHCVYVHRNGVAAAVRFAEAEYDKIVGAIA
jgi:hypothetical protein